MNLDQHQKNELLTLCRSHGWQILEALAKETAQNYRQMATMPPGKQAEQMRTWYSGLAAGIESVLQLVVDNLPRQEDNEDK